MPRYSETIFEHCRNPRNAGSLADADAVGTATHRGGSPRVNFYIKIREAKIQSITFTADGCGVAIAAASILTELAVLQSIEACQKISTERLIESMGGLPHDKRYCAQLVMDAFQDALEQLS